MSEKQRVQGKLIKHGMVHFRAQLYATRFELLSTMIRGSRRWRYSRDLANLLHRLGETIDSPNFTDVDITFLNHAIPVFLASESNQWDIGLMELLVQFHDCVPAEIMDKISWHPDDLFRKRLDRVKSRRT